MKKTFIWIVILFLLSCNVFAYCNETISYSDSQNYSIVRSCTPTYDNYSFISIIFVLLFMASFLILGIYVVERVWVKTLLVNALTLVSILVMRFISWFVSITNPEEINLINTLDHYYQWSIWGFRVMLVLNMFVILILIFNGIKRSASQQKRDDDEWDDFEW